MEDQTLPPVYYSLLKTLALILHVFKASVVNVFLLSI